MQPSRLQTLIMLAVLGMFLYQVFGQYVVPILLIFAACGAMAIGATVAAISLQPQACYWMNATLPGRRWLALVYQVTGVQILRETRTIPPINLKAVTDLLDVRIIGNRPSVHVLISTLYEIRNLDQHNPNRPHELLILNGPRGVGKLYAACETICQVLPYRSLDVIRPRESSQSDQDLSSDLFGTTGAITSILSQTQSTPQERVIVIDAGERMKLRCIDDLTAQLNAIRLAPDQFHSSLTSHCLFVLIVAADPTVGLTREMRDKKLFEATSWPAQFVARSREVIEFGRMSNEERGIAVAAMIESSFANHGVRVDSIAPQAIIDGVKIWIQHENALYLKESLVRIVDRIVKPGMAQPIRIPASLFH